MFLITTEKIWFQTSTGTNSKKESEAIVERTTNRNVQWFIHSDGDRKEEHVEEKNTLDLAYGKKKN